MGGRPPAVVRGDTATAHPGAKAVPLASTWTFPPDEGATTATSATTFFFESLASAKNDDDIRSSESGATMPAVALDEATMRGPGE